MLSEDDIYSIGRRYQEKRAAMGPVGIGALGGAGFGLLTHLLRPKDKDDRGLGSAILSVLTGAGLGAAGGLAYKSLGSNPFDPGPSQPAPKPQNKPAPPQAPVLPDIEDAFKDQFGENMVPEKPANTNPLRTPTVSAEEAAALAGSGVAGSEVTAPEALALAAATGAPAALDAVPAEATKHDAEQPAAQQVPAVPATPQAVSESAAQQPAPAQAVQPKQEQQNPAQQAAKKEAPKKVRFTPDDKRSEIAYEQLAAKHPERTITPQELRDEVTAAQTKYRSPVPYVPIDNKGTVIIAPDVPFVMTHDAAWITDKNKNGILDPKTWGTSVYKERLAKAADNNWFCVADRNGKVLPLYRLKNGNFIVAVGDPLWDPTDNPISRFGRDAKGWARDKWDAVKTPVVDGIQSTLDSLK